MDGGQRHVYDPQSTQFLTKKKKRVEKDPRPDQFFFFFGYDASSRQTEATGFQLPGRGSKESLLSTDNDDCAF